MAPVLYCWPEIYTHTHTHACAHTHKDTLDPCFTETRTDILEGPSWVRHGSINVLKLHVNSILLPLAC